ncbi:LysR family transcriptional regulator, partial [Salmonella enterica subsp. enterica serovar Enteritidis]|nr:LysR family transcriptional regulator [Salmonella enterica subsp. enterica serovar Enteritidis]
PKRITWLLDNQKRVVVPDWESSATCLSAGLCVGMVPTHFARQWIDSGKWVALTLENPFPDAACCVTWQQNEASPALAWLLDYLGDSETLNREWLREPEEAPDSGD